MSGKLITIEGLDGSGKATQSELLRRAIDGSKKVSFPNYESVSVALVKMYLAGEVGNHPSDVNAYAASSFYAVGRYATYKKEWASFYNAGGIVIADRYTTSNAIHQCSKLPRDQWNTFLGWLAEYEYKLFGIPEPDVTSYLHVDPEVSQKLMTERYKGDESKKDIYEADIEYLKQSQETAQYCAKKLGWKVIACCSNGAMRSIDEIHHDIMNVISL